MTPGRIGALTIAVFLLCSVTWAEEPGGFNWEGMNVEKSFEMEGRRVDIRITPPNHIAVSVDDSPWYQGGPGLPPPAVDEDSVCVAAEFAGVFKLKDRSALVFETWHKSDAGMAGRIWVIGVCPASAGEHCGVTCTCGAELYDVASGPPSKPRVKVVSDEELRYYSGPFRDGESGSWWAYKPTVRWGFEELKDEGAE